MKVEVNIINAFSIDGTGGNPAGVVFNADGFDKATKQLIAAKAGFPETAFISRSSQAGFKLDFFTPVKQIPHCGHATIATFSYLKQLGLVNTDKSSKETIDGIRAIEYRGEQAYMEQRAPEIRETPALNDIVASLGISENALRTDVRPTVVNTGNSFLIIPVSDEQRLKQIAYNRELVSAISEKYGLIGFYLYVPAKETDTFDASTRMFAPFYGIDEEAGTGMAAGPLAAYLYLVEKMGKTAYRIRQGDFMQPASSSLINVELNIEDGKIINLFAGGAAHLSGKIEVELN